jgi:hypothetical protein
MEIMEAPIFWHDDLYIFIIQRKKSASLSQPPHAQVSVKWTAAYSYVLNQSSPQPLK